jgi:hypothetical protein
MSAFVPGAVRAIDRDMVSPITNASAIGQRWDQPQARYVIVFGPNNQIPPTPTTLLVWRCLSVRLPAPPLSRRLAAGTFLDLVCSD